LPDKINKFNNNREELKTLNPQPSNQTLGSPGPPDTRTTVLKKWGGEERNKFSIDFTNKASLKYICAILKITTAPQNL
jgi:hypothetical protein